MVSRFIKTKILLSLVLLTGCSTLSGLYKKTFDPSRPPKCHKIYETQIANPTILIYGDGAGASEQTKVAKAMEKVCSQVKCDFGLYTGDIYEFGIQKDGDFEKKFKPWLGFKFITYGIYGNHDIWGSISGLIKQSKGSNFKYECETSEIRGPDWTIFTYDSNQLDNKEARNRFFERGKKTCERFGTHIVGGHHSPFSVEENHGDNLEAYEFIRDLGCVDYSVSGHSHSLEYHQKATVGYIVSGGAGRETRPVRVGSHIQGYVTKFVRSELGFVILELSRGPVSEPNFFNDKARKIFPVESGSIQLPHQFEIHRKRLGPTSSRPPNFRKIQSNGAAIRKVG